MRCPVCEFRPREVREAGAVTHVVWRLGVPRSLYLLVARCGL